MPRRFGRIGRHGSDRDAAVHNDRLAGYEARLGTEQKLNEWDDVFDPTETSQGCPPDNLNPGIPGQYVSLSERNRW